MIWIKFKTLLVLLCSAVTVFGQAEKSVSKISLYEDSLKNYGSIIQNDTIEENRVQANYSFIKTLVRSLKEDSSYNYPFTKLKNTISLINSEDNKFRIFTWFMMSNDGSFRYFGALQLNNTSKLMLFPFTDGIKKLENVADSVLNAQNWYGAVYYKMIKVFNKDLGKEYYILLGWKGSSRESSKKVIETLYFENGKPMFGLPVFLKGKELKRRIVFKYTSNAMMLLKFENENKEIVFDHLVAPNNQLENMPSLYAPDLSYDAYILKDGKWFFNENVELKNEPNGNEANYIDPKDANVNQVPIPEY